MKPDGFLDDAQLKKAILRHIAEGSYRLTKHAAEEQANDNLKLRDTFHVLKTGCHEHRKTTFDNRFQIWKYAIRGRTEDLKNVRVIVAFTHEMMIITVMEL